MLFSIVPVEHVIEIAVIVIPVVPVIIVVITIVPVTVIHIVPVVIIITVVTGRLIVEAGGGLCIDCRLVVESAVAAVISMTCSTGTTEKKAII